MIGTVGASRDPLIGRETDVEAVAAALVEHHLVTLTGLGGTGKTRLAGELARRAGHGPRTWFVDLASVTQAGLVPAAIARAIGVPEPKDAPLEVALVEELGAADGLLVLDNFEHVRAAAPLLDRLLAGAPRVRVLVTSRVPLEVAAEHQVRIGPLQVPEDPATIEDAPASRLFLRRARARGRLSAMDREDAEALVMLCRRLDGLPLALELAAAWTPILSPRAIVRRLEHAELTLEGEAGTRQASLDAIVESTLGLLEVPDRETFDRLGVFVAPFDVEAAAAVSGSEDVLGSLRRLVGGSLVQVGTDRSGEPGFSLLETVRAVARRRLEPRAEAEIAGRYVRHYATRSEVAAEALRTSSWSDDSLVERLADPNVTAAYEAATRLGDGNSAVRIGAALAGLSIRTGLLRETAGRVEAALQMPGLDAAVEADGWNALANLSQELGRTSIVEAMAERGIAAARRAGSPERLVRTLVTLGVARGGERGEADLREAADLGLAVGYPWGASAALHNLGNVASQTGHRAVSRDAYARAADVARSMGDLAGAGIAIGNLGAMELEEDRPGRAVELFEEARGLVGDGMAPFHRGWLHAMLALALARTGRVGLAYGHLADAADLLVESESAVFAAHWLEAAVGVLAVQHPIRAARALGAFERADAESGRSTTERPALDRAAATIERAIGRRRFETERNAGRRAEVSTTASSLMAVIRRSTPPEHHRLRGRYGTVTAREQQVLALLAEGRTDQQIAEALTISPKTASVHVANLKTKLGAETRVAAVLAAQALVGASDRRRDPPP